MSGILGDVWYLQNGYTNFADRKSFSLEIIKCDENNSDDCESEEKIADFVTHLMITQYFLTERIDYGNTETLGKRPVRAAIEFY